MGRLQEPSGPARRVGCWSIPVRAGLAAPRRSRTSVAARRRCHRPHGDAGGACGDRAWEPQGRCGAVPWWRYSSAATHSPSARRQGGRRSRRRPKRQVPSCSRSRCHKPGVQGPDGACCRGTTRLGSWLLRWFAFLSRAVFAAARVIMITKRALAWSDRLDRPGSPARLTPGPVRRRSGATPHGGAALREARGEGGTPRPRQEDAIQERARGKRLANTPDGRGADMRSASPALRCLTSITPTARQARLGIEDPLPSVPPLDSPLALRCAGAATTIATASEMSPISALPFMDRSRNFEQPMGMREGRSGDAAPYRRNTRHEKYAGRGIDRCHVARQPGGCTRFRRTPGNGIRRGRNRVPGPRDRVRAACGLPAWAMLRKQAVLRTSGLLSSAPCLLRRIFGFPYAFAPYPDHPCPYDPYPRPYHYPYDPPYPYLYYDRQAPAAEPLGDRPRVTCPLPAPSMPLGRRPARFGSAAEIRRTAGGSLIGIDQRSFSTTPTTRQLRRTGGRGWRLRTC